MRLFLAGTLLFGTLVPQPAASQPAAAFERFADEIVFFGPNDFLYGFRQTWLPHEAFLPLQRFSQLLDDRRWRADDFLPLLSHGDAKVRTLALVALYNLENAALLPSIFALVDDAASTFPALQPHAGPFPIEMTPRMLRQQTVGELAAAIVNVYMESGGYFYGPEGRRGQPGFEQYWNERAGRTSVAGWWSVRLARAGHSTSPTPSERYAALKRLRADIDRLSPPERTYILLWLHGDNGSDALVSTDELLGLSRKLGPEALLDLLRRRIRSDDPDLQPRSGNNHRYARMSLFVLQHATALLRSADAPVLLEQERWERDYQKHGITDPMISPWWAIAAAQFDDRAAPSILRSAYARFQDDYQGFHRLELAEAIWRQNGDAATAVDWFYSELMRPTSQESYHLDRLLNSGARPAAPFAKVLIDDRRFDELNWKSLEVLARWMKVWKGREAISEEELRSAWSPMGIDFYFKDKSKALEQYPKETNELLGKLARWREALRRTVTSP